MHIPLCRLYASKFLCILMHYSTVSMRLAPYAIIYDHCFMLYYALLYMPLYHLIYVILFNSALIRFYAFHMCGLYEPLIMHSYLSDNLCIQMHSYACTCGTCLMHAYASASACTVMSGLCMSMRGCALCN